MTDALTTTSGNELGALLADVGQAANEAAAGAVFSDYRSRKAANTLRRQDAGLELFSEYLAQAAGAAPTGDALATRPEAWAGITWGLVDGFVKWLLIEGYAVTTANVRLSTVETYAKLAAKAGALGTEELAMIRTVSGYSRKERKRINERRADAGVDTRRGEKKRSPVVLGPDQVDALKAACDPQAPQGRRDAVLIGLMLDLGLRCGEVASLHTESVDLKAGEIRFYRAKVDKGQTHRLPSELLATLREYVARDALHGGPLLRASTRGGHLTHAGLSERAITDRVRTLGQEIGVQGLSAHDLRHTWATRAARNGTPLDRLQDAGGWASLAMPSRYIEAAAIANEGVELGG